MAASQCPHCGDSNPEGSRFCHRCGAALAPRGKAPPDRFKTLVAVLIAVVSIVGAVLAWRAALAGSTASDADIRGTVSAINRTQALVASEADMHRNLLTYLQVRIHDLLSDRLLTESEQRPGGDVQSTSLWDQGWTEIFVAEAYLGQVDIRPEYIRPDGSYDGQAAQDIDMAHRSLGGDFDLQGRHFAQADLERARMLWLIGLALVLSVTLFFYTLATVVTSRLKYLFFALGSLVFAVVVLGALLVELALV